MTKSKKDQVQRTDSGLVLNYEVPIYVDHFEMNGGFLPDEFPREASAAWNFAQIAMSVLHELPTQITMEGEVDVSISLRNIADGVRIRYNLAEIESIMRFMPAVRREAFRSNLFWDSRFQGWLDSGGKYYDHLTRDPDKLNVQ